MAGDGANQTTKIYKVPLPYRDDMVASKAYVDQEVAAGGGGTDYTLPTASTGTKGASKQQRQAAPMSAAKMNGEVMGVVQSTSSVRGVNYKGQACITSDSTPNAANFQQGALIFSTSTNSLFIRTLMNKLSLLPVGYKPTNLSQIRTYCTGNNGFYVENRSTILTYDWRTDDGVTFGKHDGTGCGVTVHNTNIFSSTKGSGWRLSRLGNKTGHATWFYGDLGSISSGVFSPNGTSAFIANAIGIAFKFSKADTRTTRTTRKQNTQTECRIQKVAGVCRRRHRQQRKNLFLQLRDCG